MSIALDTCLGKVHVFWATTYTVLSQTPSCTANTAAAEVQSVGPCVCLSVSPSISGLSVVLVVSTDDASIKTRIENLFAIHTEAPCALQGGMVVNL